MYEFVFQFQFLSKYSKEMSIVKHLETAHLETVCTMKYKGFTHSHIYISNKNEKRS